MGVSAEVEDKGKLASARAGVSIYDEVEHVVLEEDCKEKAIVR